MAKIPKFSDLTDVKKLKELGSSLANQANVGISKVKESVDNLTDSFRGTTGEQETTTEGQDPIQQQFSAISKELKKNIAAHKAQGEAIHGLGKQLRNLHRLIQAQASEETVQDEEQPSADEPQSPEDKNQD